jgi:chaperone modulatory protein CbpM
MRVELTEVLWFEQHVLSLSELADISGLPSAVLEELLDCGAITPLESVSGPLPVPVAVPELRFGASALRAARTAHRLRVDFELDIQALALALSLVARVEDLEAQLRELRARQPQRVR